MSVTVEFRPQFHAGINKLLSMLDKNISRAPLVAAGWIIANAAKEKAPYVSGTLKRSIGVFSPDVTDRDAAGRFVSTVLVGSDVPYAARIEYGFSGMDSRGRTYHQEPRPYLRPSLDENAKQAEDAMADIFKEMLRGEF